MYRKFINACGSTISFPTEKGVIDMDRRRVLEKDGAYQGFPIRQENLQRNQESINDSWLRKRLNFVRNELKKEVRGKVVLSVKEK